MSKRILIVEDNEDARWMTKVFLESEGHEVLESGDARGGIALAISEIPDLIIMDIRLPSKKRGIGAARIIRRKESTRDIPIIFVTAYTQGPETKEVRNISNCGYLVKPFDMKDLLRMIEEYTG